MCGMHYIHMHIPTLSKTSKQKINRRERSPKITRNEAYTGVGSEQTILKAENEITWKIDIQRLTQREA